VRVDPHLLDGTHPAAHLCDTPPRGHTPREVARLLRVSADKVRCWIALGELGAINTATARCGKPRFVILPHHLEEFERRRRAATISRPAPRRKQQRFAVDYYPD
jgi:hypothetical protein